MFANVFPAKGFLLKIIVFILMFPIDNQKKLRNIFENLGNKQIDSQKVNL